MWLTAPPCRGYGCMRDEQLSETRHQALESLMSRRHQFSLRMLLLAPLLATPVLLPARLMVAAGGHAELAAAFLLAITAVLAVQAAALIVIDLCRRE